MITYVLGVGAERARFAAPPAGGVARARPSASANFSLGNLIACFRAENFRPSVFLLFVFSFFGIIKVK